VATTTFLGLTGVGLQAWSITDTNLILRLEITGVGRAGPLFPFGGPQRYGGLGWIAPYDFIPSGFDGVFPHDMNCILMPIQWLETLNLDLDWTTQQAHLFGITGFAYALEPGVTLDVYATHF